MGFFDFATRVISLEDKFIQAIDQVDGQWTIQSNWKDKTLIFISKDETITLTFLFKYDYNNPEYYQMVDNRLKAISSSLYSSIEELAERKFMQQEIEKLGGYILDNDLAQAIKDTKTIITAKEQVLNLTELVQKIREKYN